VDFLEPFIIIPTVSGAVDCTHCCHYIFSYQTAAHDTEWDKLSTHTTTTQLKVRNLDTIVALSMTSQHWITLIRKAYRTSNCIRY